MQARRRVGEQRRHREPNARRGCDERARLGDGEIAVTRRRHDLHRRTEAGGGARRQIGDRGSGCAREAPRRARRSASDPGSRAARDAPAPRRRPWNARLPEPPTASDGRGSIPRSSPQRASVAGVGDSIAASERASPTARYGRHRVGPEAPPRRRTSRSWPAALRSPGRCTERRRRPRHDRRHGSRPRRGAPGCLRSRRRRALPCRLPRRPSRGRLGETDRGCERDRRQLTSRNHRAGPG